MKQMRGIQCRVGFVRVGKTGDNSQRCLPPNPLCNCEKPSYGVEVGFGAMFGAMKAMIVDGIFEGPESEAEFRSPYPDISSMGTGVDPINL